MNSNNTEYFNTIVEISEIYIGDKPRKENNHKDDDEHNKQGRGTKKNTVVCKL